MKNFSFLAKEYCSEAPNINASVSLNPIDKPIIDSRRHSSLIYFSFIYAPRANYSWMYFCIARGSQLTLVFGLNNKDREIPLVMDVRLQLA